MIKSSRFITAPSAWSFSARLVLAMLLASTLPVAVTLASIAPPPTVQYWLIISAIALITPIVLTQFIANPIRLLTKAARSVEHGNFAPVALMQVSHTSGSIGYLARVFAKLVARVKAAQEQQMNQSITAVLLQELSTQDLDWLTAIGQHREVPMNTILLRNGQPIDTFSIVLDGTLAVVTKEVDSSYLHHAAQSNQREYENWEIHPLKSGEFIGEALFIDHNATANTTIQSLEATLLLAIPKLQLMTQLKQNIGFAARFHRAIAIILSNRLQSLLGQVGYNALTHDQQLRDVLFVLGALNDSDIDWLVATGKRQQVLANTPLIQQDRPIDALYILLDGVLSVSTTNTVCNPFLRAFSVLDYQDMGGQEVARLAKGEIVGESPFLNLQLPSTTVTAVQDSFVLAIPRSRLASKLYQDPGFAARFYKVLVSLLSNRLEDLYHRLGYVNQPEIQARSLNGTAKFADELNFNVLDEMAIASTRFDWLLRRLGGTEPA